MSYELITKKRKWNSTLSPSKKCNFFHILSFRNKCKYRFTYKTEKTAMKKLYILRTNKYFFFQHDVVEHLIFVIQTYKWLTTSTLQFELTTSKLQMTVKIWNWVLFVQKMYKESSSKSRINSSESIKNILQHSNYPE